MGGTPWLLLAALSCTRSVTSPETGSSRTEGDAALVPTLRATPATSAAIQDLPGDEEAPSGVLTYSSLDDLFAGRVSSHLDLSELSPASPLVGVGSLSGLRGEIAIFDGQIWVSYPDDSPARRTTSEQAAFLAVAKVDAWHRVTLTQDVGWQELPEALANHVRTSGASSNEPVAVRIVGRLEDIELNIVNGPALDLKQDAPRPIAKHELSQKATKRSFAQARALVTGFYARDNGQAYIHPGQVLHLHVILPDLEQMGHLDAVTLPRDTALEVGRPVKPDPKGGASAAAAARP